MKKKLLVLAALVLVFFGFIASQWQELYHHVNRLRGFPAIGGQPVFEENGRFFIHDREQERFDVTGAKEMGFALEYFNHGLGRDTIAALVNPEFLPADHETVAELIEADDEIIGINRDGVVRAYTLEMLVSHEVVNDRIGDLFYAVAYCPLADLGIIYEREIPVDQQDQILNIGVSGWTYQSTFVLYDKETLSLWYPYWNGLRAVSGELQGSRLPILSHHRYSWEKWKAKYPQTQLCIGGTMISSVTSADLHPSNLP